MPELDLNSIPQTANEAEALINGFQEPEIEEQPTPSPEVAPQDYAINYKGKEEKYPLEKLIQFAQQGRDYSQRMSEYNTRLKTDLEKALQTERQKWAPLEEKFKRYSEVEDYIKKDPAWWDHVQSLYQQRLSGQAPNGANTPPDPVVQKLVEQVGELSQFATSLKQREEAQQRESEDRALDAKVAEAREKYAQFDWVTVDEKGQNLEQRILAHAVTLGLGSKPEHFDLALKHLLHDDFVKRAEVSTKEDVGKGLQKVTKLGLGPVTERRQLALKPVANVSSKSWDEITQEAKEAAGL